MPTPHTRGEWLAPLTRSTAKARTRRTALGSSKRRPHTADTLPPIRVTNEFLPRVNEIHAYLAATEPDYETWSGEQKGARVTKVLPWADQLFEYFRNSPRTTPLFTVTIPVYAGMTRRGVKAEFDNAFEELVVPHVPETRLRSVRSQDFHRDAWLACEKVLGGRKYKDVLRHWKDLTTAWARGEVVAADQSVYRAFREWSDRPMIERIAEDLTAEAFTEDGSDDPLARIERIVREWRRPPDLVAGFAASKPVRPRKRP